MLRPFEPAESEDMVERVLTLHVKCTGDETMEVTDEDLIPMGSHTAVPVTTSLKKM